ncbi:MAG TPA: hypothetical protein VJR70_00030 [Stellaceae bacterium]|nr:hypothetical protein [Stellaceae bacterium]
MRETRRPNPAISPAPRAGRERLAQALRDNLRRRKEQARARREQRAQPSGEADADGKPPA